MKKLSMAMVALLWSMAAPAAEFVLKSAEVAPQGTFANAHIFNGFGCSGGNVSPSLSWSGAPAGTQSYAMTVYDPDAPTGSGWWHWVVINIPATATGIAKGAGVVDSKVLPIGSQQVRTDFGQGAYGGPCPPAGDKPHRYIFTLYALKVSKLDVAPDATAALAGFMIHGNMLGKAQFTALYGR